MKHIQTQKTVFCPAPFPRPPSFHPLSEKDRALMFSGKRSCFAHALLMLFLTRDPITTGRSYKNMSAGRQPFIYNSLHRTQERKSLYKRLVQFAHVFPCAHPYPIDLFRIKFSKSMSKSMSKTCALCQKHERRYEFRRFDTG